MPSAGAAEKKARSYAMPWDEACPLDKSTNSLRVLSALALSPRGLVASDTLGSAVMGVAACINKSFYVRQTFISLPDFPSPCIPGNSLIPSLGLPASSIMSIRSLLDLSMLCPSWFFECDGAHFLASTLTRVVVDAKARMRITARSFSKKAMLYRFPVSSVPPWSLMKSSRRIRYDGGRVSGERVTCEATRHTQRGQSVSRSAAACIIQGTVASLSRGWI